MLWSCQDVRWSHVWHHPHSIEYELMFIIIYIASIKLIHNKNFRPSVHPVGHFRPSVFRPSVFRPSVFRSSVLRPSVLYPLCHGSETWSMYSSAKFSVLRLSGMLIAPTFYRLYLWQFFNDFHDLGGSIFKQQNFQTTSAEMNQTNAISIVIEIKQCKRIWSRDLISST